MVGWKDIQFLIIVTASVFKTTAQVPLCTPAEEQQPHTITVSKPAIGFVWSKDNSPIVTCSGGVCALYPGVTGFNASVSSNTSSLFIFKVTRQNEGTYSCKDGPRNSSCNLRVYAKPTSVSCQQPTLQADSVTVVCSVTRIYPNPVCQFVWTINSTVSHTLQEQFITVHLTEYGDPVYYNASCSLKLPARNYSVGSHQFQVGVYPNVTGRDSDSAYITNSSWTSPQSVAQMLLCPPAEEQHPHTITFSKPGNQFVWYKDKSAIATCYFDVCVPDSGVTGYNASVSSDTSSLFIFKVTRQNEGTYSCDSGPPTTSCNLRVYAKPRSVLCQQAVLQAGSVTVVCSVTRIYPNPVCQFVWTINSTESHTLQEQFITVDSQIEYGDPVYYNASCSLKLPTRNFSVGSHQFQVGVYPNVTGRDSDSAYITNSWTSQQSVADPSIKLEPCPITDTYVEEGKPFNCSCRETANSFILATTTLSYGSTRVNATQNVTASFTADRTNGELTCEAQLPDGRKNRTTQTVKVPFGPSIFSFEANNKNSEQIILDRISGVNFSCQAEGNPSPHLSLRRNGAELQTFSDPSQKFHLTLNYSKPMAECLDTGVYTCLAEAGPRSTNKTVAVYVKCKPQFTNPEILRKIYQVQVNGTVSIIVPVFGYPEPTLILSSTNYSLAAHDFYLAYMKLEPPNGNVLLIIYIKGDQFFQNYTLSITNSEGPLTYSFEIVEGVPILPESQEGPGLNVGVVVGGVIAGVLVLNAAVLLVIFLKRRGLFSKRDNQGKNTSSRLNLQHKEKKENSSDAQGTENSHYEELADLESDMPDRAAYTNQILPDKPVYANQISNIQDKDVEYENATCSL